jgi:hypothetical protein
VIRALALVACVACAASGPLAAQAIARRPAAACASSDASSVLSLLRRVRTVRLQEADSALIVSSVPGVAIGRRGWIAVADDRDGNVKLFDASGRYLRTIGQRGSGPGEYRAPRGVAFATDTTLVIADDGALRWTLVTVNGAVVRSGPLPVARGGSAASVAGAIAVPGYAVGDSAIDLLFWMTRTGDPLGVGLPMPRPYVENRVLLGGYVYTAPGPDSTVYVVWAFSGHVMAVQGRTGPVRSVRLPSSGGFVDPLEALRRSPEALAREASPIFGIAASSQLVLVLYLTPGTEAPSPRNHLPPGREGRRPRYHALTPDLRVRASGLTGPLFVAGSADSLIAQSLGDAATGEGIALTWYVACGERNPRR